MLMHDSSETPDFAERNQKFDLTRRLAPELKRRGFRFIGLDSVPAVRGLHRSALTAVVCRELGSLRRKKGGYRDPHAATAESQGGVGPAGRTARGGCGRARITGVLRLL